MKKRDTTRFEDNYRTMNRKQYKYLYRRMLDKDLIYRAWTKVRKRKTKRPIVQYIDSKIEKYVDRMYWMIFNTRPEGVEVPNPELAFHAIDHEPRIIKEAGKWRKIYKPGIIEQWMHHIIMQVLEPIIMATAYPYSCGSMPKRGGALGRKMMVKWIKSGKGIRRFFKGDIRNFYGSIQHDVLFRELRVIIKDEWFLYVLALCFTYFPKGLPLGFYVSQWLANFLLEPLDYLVTEACDIKKYIRYADDIFCFCNSADVLHKVLIRIKRFLGRRLRLKLKRTYTITRFDYGTMGVPVNYMGYLFYRKKVFVRKPILRHMLTIANNIQVKVKNKKAIPLHWARQLVSLTGWSYKSNAYMWYKANVNSKVSMLYIKHIISKIDRRERNDRVENRVVLRAA